jgi:hypothetical protein
MSAPTCAPPPPRCASPRSDAASGRSPARRAPLTDSKHCPVVRISSLTAISPACMFASPKTQAAVDRQSRPNRKLCAYFWLRAAWKRVTQPSSHLLSFRHAFADKIDRGARACAPILFAFFPYCWKHCRSHPNTRCSCLIICEPGYPEAAEGILRDAGSARELGQSRFLRGRLPDDRYPSSPYAISASCICRSSKGGVNRSNDIIRFIQLSR